VKNKKQVSEGAVFFLLWLTRKLSSKRKKKKEKSQKTEEKIK